MKKLILAILAINIILSIYSFVDRKDWRVSILHIFLGLFIFLIQVLSVIIDELDDWFMNTKK